jgi:hypothetical protein
MDRWRKSSFSGPDNECVELAWRSEGDLAVRDSKNPHGPTLTVAASQFLTWAAGYGQADGSA